MAGLTDRCVGRRVRNEAEKVLDVRVDEEIRSRVMAGSIRDGRGAVVSDVRRIGGGWTEGGGGGTRGELRGSLTEVGAIERPVG